MTLTHTPDWRISFARKCHELAVTIEKQQKPLLLLLSNYETFEAATDEIERSVSALKGIHRELSPIETPLTHLTISTIFPLNLPLYSLVIFGVIPSAFADNVYLRPPEVMHKILERLYDMLDIAKVFPEVSLHAVPRHIFIDLYARESEVIIFTGKYENAQDIHRHCPDSMLIYNGSGINPFILFENADVDLAVAKAIEMRVFNSGQDCAGPDAFFVPKNLTESFVDKLASSLDTIRVGSTKSHTVRVGRTMKVAYLTELAAWFKKEAQHLVYGGLIDFEHQLVYPSIVRKKASLHVGEYHEFFAPFFYVLEYDSDAELSELVNRPEFSEHTMYVSVFGDNPLVESKLKTARLLRNKIVNDVEQGNHEYGGYGRLSNFVLYRSELVVQPVLISRDIHKMLSDPEAQAVH